MHTLLFGSTGTLCDTREMHRAACNAAFDVFGLGWHWSTGLYRQLAHVENVHTRLQSYACDVQGRALMPAMLDRLHARVCELFHERLRCEHIRTRPGVCRLIREARATGLKIGLVTHTDRTTLEAMDEAFSALFGLEDFDVVIGREQVKQFKPDPQAYRLALSALRCSAAGAVAVEEHSEGVRAAHELGVACLATPAEQADQAVAWGALATLDGLGDLDSPAHQLAGIPVLDNAMVTVPKLTDALGQMCRQPSLNRQAAV